MVLRWFLGAAPGVALAVALVVALADEASARRDLDRRLTRLLQGAVSAALPGDADHHVWPEPPPRVNRGILIASWRSVAGCGAGSSTGVGGIKWIGRNASGGLVNLQSQANYTRFSDGHVYTVQNQLTADVGERWNLGVVVPYLYKYLEDPFGLGFDLSNQGLGDVNVLVTRRLGPIGATNLTASLGLPTGTHRAGHLGNFLRQDRQLGAGKPSAGLLIDHTMDNVWGPAVLGGVLSYPGPANDLENYRAPSGTVYGYVGYLLGRLVPAIGVSGTAYWSADRDRGLPSDERPPWMVAANVSLEWSTDWVALLLGASLPYHTSGLQPWTAGVGLAVSPF